MDKPQWMSEMQATAKAAESGNWIQGGCSGRMITVEGGYVGDGFLADVDTKANSAHIASASPDRVLALLALCEETLNGLIGGTEVGGLFWRQKLIERLQAGPGSEGSAK